MSYQGNNSDDSGMENGVVGGNDIDRNNEICVVGNNTSPSKWYTGE